MAHREFIWLHIKKAGGSSLREALKSVYVETDKTMGVPFISLPKAEWNDNLNNFRVPLGRYDYRRMLFAKKFLYTPEEFESRFKFVIVRNPYDRAVSCWKYLWRGVVGKVRKFRARHSFGYFLNLLPKLWAEVPPKSSARRWIATHTAPVWPDITDDNGQLLVDHIARLENIEEEIVTICNQIGVPAISFPKANKGEHRESAGYREYYTPKLRAIVEKYYADDLEKLEYSF